MANKFTITETVFVHFAEHTFPFIARNQQLARIKPWLTDKCVGRNKIDLLAFLSRPIIQRDEETKEGFFVNFELAKDAAMFKLIFG